MVRPSQFRSDSEGVWSVRDREGLVAGQQLTVEYCAGNGSWVAYRAARDAQTAYLAVECKKHRVAKIWSKRQNHGLTNLTVVWGEAADFTQRQLPDGSVAQVFIHFPDPWPKRRHAKHRLMQPAFVRQLSRVLAPEGRLTFVTDAGEYATETEQVLKSDGNFAIEPITPFNPPDDYGTSYFEGLWRSQGKAIFELRAVRL